MIYVCDRYIYIFHLICIPDDPHANLHQPQETWLPQLLQRLLAPAPEDRFSSASEALNFLRAPPVLTRDPVSNGAVLPREAGTW